MRRLLTGRIGAALGGALTALLLAGGGYAIASGATGTINACVHKHGGGLYVGHCARHDRKLRWNTVGPHGPPGSPGQAGQPGQPGPAGSALAYAHVLWDGTTASFDPTQTAGMGSATITKRGTAAFCFGNLPFTPHNATANSDFKASSSGSHAIAQVEIDPPGTAATTCNAGENVQVETVSTSTGTQTPVSFYITFN
ncbi:MAG: hypothetical protein M3076_01080 [Actinomycetota bacterium]|nr:hypothetical protein [Actinomycetota bacterium]